MKKILLTIFTMFLLLNNQAYADYVDAASFIVSSAMVGEISDDINKNPQNIDAYETRGVLYLKYLHEIDNAISDFNYAIEHNSNNPKNYIYRGFAKFLLGNKEEALLDAQKAIDIGENKKTPDADAYLLRSLIHMRDSKYFENNLKDLNKAVEISEQLNNPYITDEYIYYVRGNFLYALNQRQEALNDYSKAIDINAQKTAINSILIVKAEMDKKVSSSTLCYISDVYKARGIVKIDFEDYKGALLDTNKAIEIDEKNEHPDSEAYLTRATLYHKMNSSKKAIEDISQAIKINPNDIRTYALRGVIELEIAKEEKSLQYMDSAIQDFDIVKNKYLVAKDTKNYKAALKMYNSAIKQRKLLKKELK